MNYFKIEYYSKSSEDNSDVEYTYVVKSNMIDRTLKGRISRDEKFYSEISTQWKTVENDGQFETWRKDIKPSVIKRWQEEFLSPETERFVLVKKALTYEANNQLEEECDYNWREMYTIY